MATYFVIYGKGSKPSAVKCVVKILPVSSLIVFILLNGLTLDDTGGYARRVMYGLFCSLIGDVYIMFKMNKIFVCIAIIQFTLAYAMYTLAFGFTPLKPKMMYGLLIAGIWVYIFILLHMDGTKRRVLAVPVLVYISAICTMAWRATVRVGLFDNRWRVPKLCACIGARLFLISGLLLAGDMFIFSVPWSEYLITLPYYGAQFGITVSVIGSPEDEVFRKRTPIPKVLTRVFNICS